MHEPNREGAAVSTTSGNSFSDHILPAKPLHGSLFPPSFKLPSACRPPYARNEKNPACKFSAVYVHIMLRASLIHGCFLIAAHLDVLREGYEQV